MIAGDGDLMEGVAHEAASLAGHLGLGKLIYLYDANHISLDGATSLSFTDGRRRACSRAYGWHVQSVADGNDLDGDRRARSRRRRRSTDTAVARSSSGRTIGFGSPKQGTFGVHGSPLGAEQVVETKKALGYPSTEPFFVPPEALAHLRTARRPRQGRRGRLARALRGVPRGAPRPRRRARARDCAASCPPGWDAELPKFAADRQADRDAQPPAAR